MAPLTCASTMLAAVVALRFAGSVQAASPAKNVLFIAVDDMRPDIGAFNFSLAHTPNMDGLAATGMTFKRAYVQYAFCAPSRNSFMSGRRPDTTRVWNFQDHFRQPRSAPGGGAGGEDWLSLPGYFKANGYITLGSGKLFHPQVPPDNDYNKSWSHPYAYYSPECIPPHCPSTRLPAGVLPSGADPFAPENFACASKDPPEGKYTLCPTTTDKDETRWSHMLEDQRIQASCSQQLKIAASQVKAGKSAGFFVGCGFHKPHVPWVFPEEFLGFYPDNLSDIPLASRTLAPVGMPDIAWHHPADVAGMSNGPYDNGNQTRARNFRRGYYAAVSYTDYNIGKVLATLSAVGMEETTAVVVFGDHGWQLGEHATWAKMTNFEVAVRTPLIIRAPWMANSVGKTTDVLAEAVDLFPTLAALTGLPTPQSQGQLLNGTNLAPVFADPSDTSPKAAAYSQFAKPFRNQPFEFWPTPARNATQVMGYSVRTDSWRYTCWFGFVGAEVRVDFNDIIGRELYDHRGDPGDLDWEGEHVNVVNATANAAVVQQMHTMLLAYSQLK